MSETYQIKALLNGAVYSTLDHILLNRARPLRRSLSEIMPSQPPYHTFEKVESQVPGLWVPIIVWLIVGPGGPILVDTGLSSCQELRRSFLKHNGVAIPCLQKPEWKLDQQLLNMGIQPIDIHEIILTHTHGDHIGDNEKFPNAKFYVHESEIPLCMNPAPWAPSYRPDNAAHLHNVIDHAILLSGDQQLTPGIRLLHVGGHSPGSMAVLVDTKKGRVSIAGDLIHSYKNLELDWPIGAFWDLNQVMQSMHRISQEANLILPNHDWEIWERFPGGSIG